eukprot:COSAG06_NODE_2861_length_6161_cov_22.755856_1_plen_271_part_00
MCCRDIQIKSYAGFLPNLILPPLLGTSISHWPFGSKEDAYREMFLGAALFQFIGAALILMMDLPSNVKEGEGLRPWLSRQCRRCARVDGPALPPLGARLCDGLCFPEESSKVRWDHELFIKGRQSSGESEGAAAAAVRVVKGGGRRAGGSRSTGPYMNGAGEEEEEEREDEETRAKRDFTAELLRVSGRAAIGLEPFDVADRDDAAAAGAGGRGRERGRGRGGGEQSNQQTAAEVRDMLRLRAQRRGAFDNDLRRYGGGGAGDYRTARRY